MTIETLSEDTIRSLAAQFGTLPEAIQAATGMYLPPEKSPAYYEGYVNAIVMLARMVTSWYSGGITYSSVVSRRR